MLNKITLTAETFITLCARIRTFASVRSGMQKEVLPIGKTFVTNRTEERLYSSMSAHVPQQTVLISEALVTLSASKACFSKPIGSRHIVFIHVTQACNL